MAADAPPTAAGSLPTKTSCMALFPGVAGRENWHQRGGPLFPADRPERSLRRNQRQQPPLTPHGSRLTAHRSRLTAHRSRLTAHRSPLTAHRWPGGSDSDGTRVP